MIVYLIFQTICKPAPFHTDQEAIQERENCDYNTKITYKMARSGDVPRPVRVYADGIYDVFHQGHARQLMQVHFGIHLPNLIKSIAFCSISYHSKEMKLRH